MTQATVQQREVPPVRRPSLQLALVMGLLGAAASAYAYLELFRLG